MRSFSTFALLAVCLALGSVGCSHVRPYQKEHMAKIRTQVDRDANARSFEEKVWMVRSGAAGGSGKPGGGCGCN